MARPAAVRQPNAITDRHAAYAARAYATLETTEAEVRLQPQITPTLRMIAKILRKSGRPSDPMYYLSASDDPMAIVIRKLYYSMPTALARSVPLEAFCLAARVSPLRVVEIITAIAVRLSVQSSAIIAAVTHPQVVEKTVDMALTDDGEADRATLHRATGFLPTPKGAQTNITVTQNAHAAAAAAPILVPAHAPPPEATIQRLTNRFNDEQRALPEPAVTLDVVPARDTTPAVELVEAQFANDDNSDEDEV
jgi:hypothetical protein